MSQTARAVVVGGGYAGIAAALGLADRGHIVTLLESRRHWGGRATSWPDPRMGDVLDNGQHVWLGCYGNTRGLLVRLGTADQVGFAPDLDLRYREIGGRAYRLRAPAVLGRLGLALGLAGFGAIPWRERVALGRALEQAPPPDPLDTVEAWLDRLGQGKGARRAFWTPLTEAALNLPPADAAASLLHAVVVRAFRGGAADAAVGLPRTGLAELLTPIEDALAARGGRARLGTPARAVRLGDRGAAFLVELDTGEAMPADCVVIATPASDARALIDGRLRDSAPGLERAAAVPSAPIVTVTLWFEARALEAPMLGLLAPAAGGGPGFQWAFDRGTLVPRTSAAWPLTLVASAARHMAGLPTAAIVERARAALDAYRITRATPLASRVVKEPHATPAFTPEHAARRPSVASGLPGLAFAGDWTDTGLPATIEGAVTSGMAAARHVLGSAILPDQNPRPAP